MNESNKNEKGIKSDCFCGMWRNEGEVVFLTDATNNQADIVHPKPIHARLIRYVSPEDAAERVDNTDDWEQMACFLFGYTELGCLVDDDKVWHVIAEAAGKVGHCK